MPGTVAHQFCPWKYPDKNSGVACHSLLQGIFLIQGPNPGLLHCRQILTIWATREAVKHWWPSFNQICLEYGSYYSIPSATLILLFTLSGNINPRLKTNRYWFQNSVPSRPTEEVFTEHVTSKFHLSKEESKNHGLNLPWDLPNSSNLLFVNPCRFGLQFHPRVLILTHSLAQIRTLILCLIMASVQLWLMSWTRLCCSDAKSCWTLCEPMNCSRPGFPVLHCLPEFTQTHVRWVGNIQPSHPMSPPSPPALNLFQHQGLLQWVSSSHQVTKVLEFQQQSFQWIFRVDFL